MTSQAILLKNHQVPSSHTIKVIFVGDTKTGKTKYAKKCLGESFNGYQTTLGVEVMPYSYKMNNGNYGKINIWDCSGNPKTMGLSNGYWISADYAIVFSDNYIPSLVQKNIPYIKFNPSLTLEQHLGL